VEMSAHVQRRLTSLWGDAPQRHAQDQRPKRAEPIRSAILPRRRIRLLRDPSGNKLACCTVAARLKSIEPRTAMSNTQQRKRLRGGVKRSGLPVRSGLAVWQQFVLMAYIEKHIAESISVRALARFVYASSHCFCRAFKQSFGMPPRRYVVHRRIKRAKTLLACSALSIANTAIALGFRRPSSFSTAFQQVTGMTPNEFRQAHRY
jgi:AraC-like DNA-binding protein